MKLETERLTITEFTPDMAQAVHENSLDEDTRRFLPDEVFETPEDAERTIAFLTAQYGSADGPQVHPVLLQDGTCIGYVQAVPIEGAAWEIGYHIGKPYTGRGYATEAVAAFLPAIMERLHINAISGICDAENAASCRVLEKCGFTLDYEGPGEYQGEWKEIKRYSYSCGAASKVQSAFAKCTAGDNRRRAT